MAKIQAVKGTRDIFDPEIGEWLVLESAIRDYFEKFFYREIRTPIFEYTELFARGIGDQTEVVQKEMYTFLDKGGRSITLRPENTASVVRAIVENNLLEKFYPAKFFYIGPMFRYDKPQKGRLRQFHQFGAEILGVDSALCDAELIYSARNFLETVRIKETTLELNSVGCRECRPLYVETLRQEALKHQLDFCPDCRRRSEQNPLRIFDCKVPSCREAAGLLPKISDHLCPECTSHFQQLQDHLKALKVDFRLQPRLVRGLDYYTRTAFEIVTEIDGAQNAVLGGGRYNNLVRELGGPDIGAIGFAAGMERILLNLREPLARQRAGKRFFVAYQPDCQDEALRLAGRLWSLGVSAIASYEPVNFKKQLARASKSAADFVLILGEEEIRAGIIAVKEMASGQQTEIREEELAKWLQQFR